MQLKNIILLLSFILISLPSHTAEQSPLTKKEMAYKAAKIFSYTAQIGIAAFVLRCMQYDGRHVGLCDIALDFKRSDYKEAFQGIAFHIPPVTILCHGAYGLYSEIQPLIKTYYEKRKTL